MSKYRVAVDVGGTFMEPFVLDEEGRVLRNTTRQFRESLMKRTVSAWT